MNQIDKQKELRLDMFYLGIRQCDLIDQIRADGGKATKGHISEILNGRVEARPDKWKRIERAFKKFKRKK